MKKLLCLAVLLFCSAPAMAADFVYEGQWKTTGRRKLDGIMTAEVDMVGKEKWKARFYGVWQGVDYDYTVNFTGPADNLKGTAVIDGADYQWTGKIDQESPGWFSGDFTGSRYDGWFKLKQKTPK